MDNSQIIFLINDDIRAIKAVYEDGGKTEIFKTFDPDIRVDDCVVVTSATRHEMTVVKVVEVDVDVNLESTTPIKWCVQRIDVDSFKDIRRQEEVAITKVQSAQRRKKREEMREALLADQREEILALEISTKPETEVTE